MQVAQAINHLVRLRPQSAYISQANDLINQNPELLHATPSLTLRDCHEYLQVVQCAFDTPSGKHATKVNGQPVSNHLF